MNTQHFKFLLREKKRELQSALQGTSQFSEKGALLSQMLEQVQDAAHRIDSGIYGRCLACGREIEISRLEEVLWTAFCLKDQDQDDQSRKVNQGNAVYSGFARDRRSCAWWLQNQKTNPTPPGQPLLA